MFRRRVIVIRTSDSRRNSDNKRKQNAEHYVLIPVPVLVVFNVCTARFVEERKSTQRNAAPSIAELKAYGIMEHIRLMSRYQKPERGKYADDIHNYSPSELSNPIQYSFENFHNYTVYTFVFPIAFSLSLPFVYGAIKTVFPLL